MAIVVGNILLRGLSGSLGKTLVFRYSKKQTVVSLHPGKREKALTEAQRRHQERFKLAAAQAKLVMSDAEQLALYAARMGRKRNVYAFLVGEFLKERGLP